MCAGLTGAAQQGPVRVALPLTQRSEELCQPCRSPQTSPALHTRAGIVQLPDRVLQARPLPLLPTLSLLLSNLNASKLPSPGTARPWPVFWMPPTHASLPIKSPPLKAPFQVSLNHSALHVLFHQPLSPSLDMLQAG